MTRGESDYLKRKGVGSYGIRFRRNEQHSNAAVVPMYDINGRLWSYQLLNADGSKINAKGGRASGLFHSLKPIINQQPFGIAESYVISATCMELTTIPMICAFSSYNLKDIALTWARKCPASLIILFADNDRHLPSNKGLECARAAAAALGNRAIVAAPNFADRAPAKDASDWNDLVRLAGKEEVVEQFSQVIDNLDSKPNFL